MLLRLAEGCKDQKIFFTTTNITKPLSWQEKKLGF